MDSPRQPPSTAHRRRLSARHVQRARVNSNARGTFTFTGLYSSGGAPVAGRTGADFADFLLGVPQQATLQVGGTSHLRQHSFDAYIEDNWQKNAKLTFNLGLRYEFAMPYVELNGQMANLDVTPTFTAVAPVLPGGTGPYTGAFPAGLLNTRREQSRTAPRRRVPPGERHDPARRLQHHLQQRVVRVDRAAARRRSRRSPKPKRSSRRRPDR